MKMKKWLALLTAMILLFPILTEEGRVKAVYDPRGFRMCPLVRECAHVPLDRDFVRAVRRAGRILAEDPTCAAIRRLYNIKEDFIFSCPCSAKTVCAERRSPSAIRPAVNLFRLCPAP